MNPFIWLPIVALDYILCAWLTHKNSSSGERMWFWASYACSLLPLWAVIARRSKNVVYDGMLFDTTVVIAYTAAILYFTKSFGKLGPVNYLGLLLIFAGIYAFKKGT